MPDAGALPHALTLDRPESALRLFAYTLLCPSRFLPARGLLRDLTAAPDARMGNVLRRWVLLQINLAPYLLTADMLPDPDRPDTQLRLGDTLLVSPVLTEEGAAETYLPAGRWTNLLDGTVRTGGVVRSMHGANTAPIYVRENAVLPVAFCDRRVRSVYADQVTLHWFQPAEEAVCVLPNGEKWQLWHGADGFSAETDSVLPWHLIVHVGDEERMIR